MRKTMNAARKNWINWHKPPTGYHSCASSLLPPQGWRFSFGISRKPLLSSYLPLALHLHFYAHTLPWHTEDEQTYLKDFQSVLKDYMARFDDGWKGFPMNGARYLSDDMLESRDLDLFGKGSLYQYICTASTIWGQDQLAFWLQLPGRGFAKNSAPQIVQEIISRQQAVAELSQKPEFCMEFETYARELRSIEYEKSRKIMDSFFQALETKNAFPAVCRILIGLFPLLTLTFLFSALLGIHRHLTMPIAFLLVFAQLVSAGLGFYRNNKILSPIYQMNRANSSRPINHQRIFTGSTRWGS